jgi:hypothetical protein
MVKTGFLFSEDEAIHLVLQISYALKDMYNNQSLYLPIYVSIYLSVYLSV